MEKTDFELASEYARSTDTVAFRFLVDRHSRLVYHLAYRLTGDHHEAEDVTQDVFMILIRKMRKFKEGKSFRAWAAGITIRTALKAVRSRSRRVKRERRMMAMSADEDNGVREPVSEAERRELAQQVEGMLETLPTDNRVPLVLHHMEGFSYAEVGEALGIPEGTVKSRVSRGLEQVRSGVNRRGKEFSLAALIPVFGRIPSPALPAGLDAALKALPLKAAASAGLAAKTAALLEGVTALKTAVAGIILCLVTAGGVLMLWDAGPDSLNDATVDAPAESSWEEDSPPPPEPPPGKRSGLSPPAREPKDATSGEGEVAGEKTDEKPAELGVGEANSPKRVRIAGEEGVVIRSKRAKSPSIRRITSGEGLQRMGNIRIVGGPGGRGRMAPAGWSKWARRPPAKGDCTVTGWVLDSGGRPVSGATVYRMKPGTDRGPELKVSFGKLIKVATTDGGGAFSAEYLPAGEYYVAGNHLNLLNTDRGLFTEGAVKVSLMSGQKKTGITIQLPLSLASVGSLAGRVVDEDGNPIAGAEVFAGYFRAFSDKGGAFSIPALRAGAHTLSASRTGYRAVETGVEIAGGQKTSADVILPLLQKGEYGISGLVTDHDGNPVEGAAIYIMGDRRTLRSGRTDPAGGFRFDDIAKKEVRFQVSKRGYSSHVVNLSLSSFDLTVILDRTAAVTGFVKSSASGGILDLFNIKLLIQDAEGNWKPSRSQSRYSEDGSFRVEGRCGKWLLEVEAPGHGPAYFEIDMPVEGDEMKKVDLLLAPSKE